MGYEPKVPPIPTRPQEVKYIEDLAQEYIDQPFYKYYSPEYMRVTKMNLSEDINKVQVRWYSNFAVGTPS